MYFRNKYEKEKNIICFNEIKEAVGAFHKSGMMHQLVGNDVGKVFE